MKREILHCIISTSPGHPIIVLSKMAIFLIQPLRPLNVCISLYPFRTQITYIDIYMYTHTKIKI